MRARSGLLGCLSAAVAIAVSAKASGQTPTPGQNVNMVSGTKWPGGDKFLQRQNEPAIAVSTRNPLHLLAGANDYRTVDLPLPDELPSPTLTGDAWLGLFKSFNGGQTWQSTLIPGYPQDRTPEGLSSPLHENLHAVPPRAGFTTASDPVVRSGTNGLFYYAGIAFNRTTNNGVVFVSRFIDLNNRENGNAAPSSPFDPSTDPIRYTGTSLVDSSSGSEFLDKPWLAVDIPRHGAATCNFLVSQPEPLQPHRTVPQSFPAGNVYIVYTKFFLDSAGKPIRSQLLFKRSQDCGEHWSPPIPLTALDEWKHVEPTLHQGATLAVDPQAGFVYAAWRRFKGSVSPDSILGAASFDGGRTFTPGIPLVTLPAFSFVANPPGESFFDQATTGTSFRTNAFPALAVDDSGIRGWPGRIYLAWSQRFTLMDGVRHARIMMLTLPGSIFINSSGIPQVRTFPVDDAPLLDDVGTSFARGHQFMPQLTFTGGKLLALYYDMRLDHSYGTFAAAPPTPEKFVPFLETRLFAGELLPPANKGAVFTPFVDDANPPLSRRRHTLDVVVAEAKPSSLPLKFTVARVSRYKTGIRPTGTGLIEQLQINPPGLPLFKGGTAPFLGDYLDIAGQTFVAQADGTWAFNTAPLEAPFRIATWTSNQDVRPPPPRPPLAPDWTSYTPVGGQDGVRDSIFNPGVSVPACIPGTEGMRNQNIYSSNITEGVLLSSPQNSKRLSLTLQRAFVVVLQNFTTSGRTFLLTIVNQPGVGGFASFVQAAKVPPMQPATTSIEVTIGPRSAVARSVFALSANPTASITVKAQEIGGVGFSTFVALNPDGTVPPLIDPEGAPAGAFIAVAELYNPDVANPDVANPNEAKWAIPNPDVANPDVANPDVANPDVANPDVANPDVANVNVMNPDVANPDVANPLVSDATYIVTNAGNTYSSYDVKLVGSGPGSQLNAPLQLILNKSYRTPVALNCYLREETQNTLQSNVREPVVFDPSQITNPDVANATLSLGPGETGLVTLRGNVDLATMEQFVSHVTPVVVAQGANTGEETPRFAAPLTIITTSLPDAVQPGEYRATLQAVGGAVPYTWAEVVTDGTNIPSGLSLDSQGVIFGAPHVGLEGPQTFPFTVRVTDRKGAVRTADLSITVVEPLGMWTPWSPSGDARSLPVATVGESYFVELLPLGGIAPYTWSQSGLPAGMDFFNPAGGAISGTPTVAGDWVATLRIVDSSHPAQHFSADFAFKAIQRVATGSIAGFTRDFNTDAPIEGAIVTLLDPAGHLVGTVATDPRGAFRFDNLPPGEYSFDVVGPPGHGDGAGTVPVSAGQEIAPIIRLLPTGAVSGLVIDAATGGSIAGATVTITGGPVEGFNRSAVTDEFGSYYIPGLSPGMYTVQVAATGYETAVQAVEVFATVVGVNFRLLLQL